MRRGRNRNGGRKWKIAMLKHADSRFCVKVLKAGRAEAQKWSAVGFYTSVALKQKSEGGGVVVVVFAWFDLVFISLFLKS